MNTPQRPRGTRDILPDQQPAWQHVMAAAERVAARFGFQRITTPTFEYRSLFERSIGQGTDVMDKELFVVKGRSAEAEEEYALRPEGTAGIVRAFLENGLHLKPQPVKLWSFVNNFRYDRPQKGRYREHVQWDLELFGDSSAFNDAWIIWSTWQFLGSECGLKDLMLQLNSLGTNEERTAYQQALVTFLRERESELSEDSRRRLNLNPLRILDSKDATDQRLLEGAPALQDFFGEDSRVRFAAVQDYLRAWDIPFTLNPHLVRGLDYYCHTAFEWTTEGAGGQQSSLGGGGRYDGLVTQLGGQPIGAVGAGIGLERVIEECERQGITFPSSAAMPVAVVAADPESIPEAAKLLKVLSSQGTSVLADFEKAGVGAQLKFATKHGAATAYILGTAELASGTVVRKDLTTGDQEIVPLPH